MPLELDPKAPVQCDVRVEIAAMPEQVWAVHTDVARWPEWMTMITAARLEGPLARGSVLHWSIAGLDIQSRLADVQPKRRLAWRGGDGGEQIGIHIWEFVRSGASTIVANRESICGVANPERHQELLHEAMTFWNTALKARVESLYPR